MIRCERWRATFSPRGWICNDDNEGMFGSAGEFRDTCTSDEETARKLREIEAKKQRERERRMRKKEKERARKKTQRGEWCERECRGKGGRKSLVCIRVTLYHEAIAQVGTRPP